jgi:hypothetical protein
MVTFRLLATVTDELIVVAAVAVVTRSPPVKFITAAPVDDLSNVIPKPLVGVILNEPPVVEIVALPLLGAVIVKALLPAPLSMLYIDAPEAFKDEPELNVSERVLILIVPPPSTV